MGNNDRITSIRNYLPLKSKQTHKKNIGLLIDGPNMLRKEFNLDLESIRDLMSEHGKMRVGKVLLNQYASDKLIEAIVNQGFTPIVVAGDTDVHLAMEAMELIYNPNIDILALMTRNADFLPLLNKTKENGKETIVIGAEPGFSIALQNTTDSSIIIKKSPPHTTPGK